MYVLTRDVKDRETKFTFQISYLPHPESDESYVILVVPVPSRWNEHVRFIQN